MLAGGLPCLVAQHSGPPPRIAPRSVLAIDIDDSGRITKLYNILADRKLSGLLPA